MKGPDMLHEWPVTLDDLYNGALKRLAIQRKKFDVKTGTLVSVKEVLQLKIYPGMEDGNFTLINF